MPLSADVGGTPVRVGGAIKEPTQIRYVAPVYPEIARTAGVTGVVILELTIAPSGLVRDAKALRPVALLDQAAMDAVKQWQFTPTILNGVAVPVMMTVTVNFAAGDPSAQRRGGLGERAALGRQCHHHAGGRADRQSTGAVGGEIREPKKIRDVRPMYPREAQAARVQGAVIMEAVIDAMAMSPTSSSCALRTSCWITAAMDAVRQWKSTPTTINGMPVSVIMTVTVNFTLGGI